MQISSIGRLVTRALWGAVFALLVAAAATPLFGQQPPASVRTAEVVRQPSQNFHRVLGTLRALSRSQIASRESAPVVEVPVREGDTVRKGELLAKLDDDRLRAQRTEAEADRTAAQSAIRRFEAELNRARRNFEMNRRLYENRTLAERDQLDAVRDLEVAEAQLQEARHTLAQAESRLELLNVRLADTEIRAPYDAFVVARHTEAGEWVNPGDPVVTIVSQELEAVLSVPERFSAPVRAHADEIQLTISATGEAVRTNSLSKVAEVDQRARTFPLIAKVDDPNAILTAGMSVSASIPAGSLEERLVLPMDAVLRSAAGAYVFRVGTNDEGATVADQVPVTVLFERGSDVAVESETLSPGDRVVIEGNERLTPNRELAIIADPPTVSMAPAVGSTANQ